MPEACQSSSLTRLRSLMPLVALGDVLLTGCMVDLNKLATNRQRPAKVEQSVRPGGSVLLHPTRA